MLIDQINSVIPIKSNVVLQQNEEYGFNIQQIIPQDGPFQLIISDGLRKRKQEVNESNSGLEHIEIYFCLPDYWNLDNQSWPIHWLNRIAQVPQKNETWFGNGDTIPAGYPPEDLQENFKANHFILSRPIFLEEYLAGEKWKGDFQPLAIIPIFKTEVDYKLRNSHTILFRKFNKLGVSELVDPYRPSTCRKRVLGMF